MINVNDFLKTAVLTFKVVCSPAAVFRLNDTWHDKMTKLFYEVLIMRLSAA